ncbi:MAG: hypothetical protein ACYTGN_16660 [Planctomycetota bacterium]|jgi:hypothetical protein
MKIRVNKIGSVASRCDLPQDIEVSRMVEARRGNVLVVRALEEKRIYDVLELTNGRMAHISKNDVIVGALGTRQALCGFVGRIPGAIKPGDTIHVLNLGGVLGQCFSENRDVGHPLQVEVLGMAVRGGKPVNIADGALPTSDDLTLQAPIVMINGTCMNSGKTRAATEVISRLAQRGYRVGAAKLTGVAALRDTLAMVDHGAVAGLSFLDCGLPSTTDVDELPAVAKGVLNALAAHEVDVVVAETGDGIIGNYGVRALLEDEQIRAAAACHVLTANDLVAAWGGQKLMEDELGLKIGVMAGPATDNEVGVRYVTEQLGIKSANARTHGAALADFVEEAAFRR